MPDRSENLKDQFLLDLLSKEPEKMASLWLLERVPHLFQDNRELYIDWKLKLAHKLQVDCASVMLVGSSCVGFSLNPNKNYKLFNDSSDVDVAVVSEYYFTEAWRFFRNLGSRLHSLKPREKHSIEEHVRKYIYWGTITTDHILPLFPFGSKWQQAISDMSNLTPTDSRVIKIRLYKDLESLRGYHVSNLRDLRNKLLEQGDK